MLGSIALGRPCRSLQILDPLRQILDQGHAPDDVGTGGLKDVGITVFFQPDPKPIKKLEGTRNPLPNQLDRPFIDCGFCSKRDSDVHDLLLTASCRHGSQWRCSAYPVSWRS